MGLYDADNTVFDDLSLPANITKVNLVSKLLIDCAELEIIYPDPDMMKESIKYWSLAHLQSWEMYYASLHKANYNPFDDYDRHEEIEINYHDYPGATTTTSQRAFNDSTLTDIGKLTQGGDNTGWRTTETHAYGNSALGTNQDIMNKEIELRIKYNVIDLIISDFKKDFCLCVY